MTFSSHLVRRHKPYLRSLCGSNLEDTTRAEEADVKLHEEVDLPKNDGDGIHAGPCKSQANRSESAYDHGDDDGARVDDRQVPSELH